MYETLHVEFLKRRREWFQTGPMVHQLSYLILRTNIYQNVNRNTSLTGVESEIRRNLLECFTSILWYKQHINVYETSFNV
jgi:hypothetical protein